MTNVTLSIKDSIYRRMKKYSEIKWSEFVRKAIQLRLDELDSLENDDHESILSTLASEKVLEKDWNNKYDECWNDV